jgi:gas vesicle protein
MEKEITNMVQETQETERQRSGFVGILGGLIIGSVAGAVAMLLLAPQSGKKTRMLIQDKGIELRDRATGMVDEAFEQVRSNSSKIAASGITKADELKEQGQDLLAEQMDRVSAAARAGKKAIQNVLS